MWRNELDQTDSAVLSPKLKSKKTTLDCSLFGLIFCSMIYELYCSELLGLEKQIKTRQILL
uniref:Uncharacterized protein n=1 Tax=Lepeophtheirus salmonis TaxID=72036 RepID=A0A0K2THY4_LEPSM